MKKTVVKKEILDKIERKLNEKYKELANELNNHGLTLKDENPMNGKDSLISKEEIDIIEGEDVIEENEIFLIKSALHRIEIGTYGHCRKCNKSIPVKRLLALPHAKYCVKCKEDEEKDA